MIYEGAVIRRLVTPNHPGDPMLDDPTAAVQCRVEYVRDDARAPASGSWTREFGEAHVYRRHLDADRRARVIDPNCFARVIQDRAEGPSRTGNGARSPRRQATPATNLSGGVERLAGAKPDSQRRHASEQKCDDLGNSGVASLNESLRRADSAVEQPTSIAGSRQLAISGRSAPPAQNNLPAVDGPSAGAVKRPSGFGELGQGSGGGNQSTSTRKTRSAGKALSKVARKAALKSAHERVTAHEHAGSHWWEQGQYA